MQDVVSFLVLFNYIIPISLYVTLEVQKFVGAFFFVWDVELYDEEQDMPAKCNSSDLNEELGQVEYLFSDKTGTLTRNVMEFKECSIDGVKFFDRGGNLVYEENGDGVDRIDGGGENEYIPDERTVRRFLEVLALCHTVEATEQEGTGRITYSAASPDEKALVEACSNYGVVFRCFSFQFVHRTFTIKCNICFAAARRRTRTATRFLRFRSTLQRTAAFTSATTASTSSISTLTESACRS